ncbi:NADPH-dependent 7-cyano-7-deazaguanine reductase QueF [Oleiagrimonas sp. C23AA]|uniref:NADPH-dependent 7-cyano-7-deazaguanine reductase QueF n=1 Tax=Oleiagrimonas sp. C23AA TaxID=2719047 RepID=UPI0014226997|nr:NADPH-dependent 7-cyano-7-deazaguanine reductase QueF [Oleiagrimonas sp. C23AA]NII11241.1 NADPH-dependent 7-cyano-7-deazaguanine reductase QueF [Oleiagrimonas sp. C23AA]
MSTPEHSPLGKSSDYPRQYDPAQLFPIPRRDKRAEIGIDDGALPFSGVDIWNAYELSWLDTRGKPQVAVARFDVPADSPNIIESKSFKLYLNSFSAERLDTATLSQRLREDLSAAAGAPVQVELTEARDFATLSLSEPDGIVIDTLDIAIDHYGPPCAEFLSARGAPVEERLVSHLLKSNCPVTGQPDWGSVIIAYRGPAIDHKGLLRYLISFREHNEFHEQCVERIWTDLMQRCAPSFLSVYARYTRRGGLDINPFRSSEPAPTPPNPRGARQ